MPDLLGESSVLAQHGLEKRWVKDETKAEADVESISVVESVPEFVGLASTEPGTTRAGASKQSISRFGGDWSALDQACPIVLDSATRRLLHHCKSHSRGRSFRILSDYYDYD